MPRGRKPKTKVITTDTNTGNNSDATVNVTEEQPEPKELVRYAGETCINHLANEDFCIIYAGERKWYNWVLEMIEKHPDEIEVLKHFDTDYRSIEVKVPYTVFCTLRWPKTVSYTEEERAAIGQRLLNARKNKTKEEQK